MQILPVTKGHCHGSHFSFYMWGVHWYCLTNTTEPSMCGSNAALYQIALTTCFMLQVQMQRCASHLILIIGSVCLCHCERLSVTCYFLAPCDKRKHTVHAHQQAASQASTDSAWRHLVWLPHSSLGFQRPVGCCSYRLTKHYRKVLQSHS